MTISTGLRTVAVLQAVLPVALGIEALLGRTVLTVGGGWRGAPAIGLLALYMATSWAGSYLLLRGRDRGIVFSLVAQLLQVLQIQARAFVYTCYSGAYIGLVLQQHNVGWGLAVGGEATILLKPPQEVGAEPQLIVNLLAIAGIVILLRASRAAGASSDEVPVGEGQISTTSGSRSA